MKITTMATMAATAAQPSPTSNSARNISELAGEQAERREAREGHQPDAEDAPEGGRRASRARTPSIWLVPSAAMISPEVRNSTLLARPWPRMCSRTAAMASGMPAAAPKGDQPHVLDAVVGEHPLVVALGEQQRRGDGQRQQGHDHEQRAGERRARRLRSPTALNRRMA